MRALRIVLTVAIVVVTGAEPAASTAGSAATAWSPELSLRAGPPAVTLVPGSDLHLGIYVTSGSRPFEVRTRRPSYREPIVATYVTGGGERELPSGLVTNFSGFPGFSRLTFTDERGRIVYDRQEAFCPNAGARRAGPDAARRTPYPADCSGNPFALGSVWGLPAGWGAPAVLPWDAGRELALPPGTYTATVTIDERYRDLFGVADAAGSASVRVTVPASGARDRDHAHNPLPEPDRHVAGGPGGPGGPRGRHGWQPDLHALPAWDVELAQTEDAAQLRFATTFWNAGPAPLVLEGFRRPGENVLAASQFFYDRTGRERGHTPVGSMVWHEEHAHWHVSDFARYRLLDEHERVVLPGTKISFCVLSTEAIDLTVPGAARRPELDADQFLACAIEPGTTLSLRQMLDPGFGDTYANQVDGQAFDITGLPNGTYHIEIDVNPDRNLHETSTANNRSRRTVILGGRPGARTATVPPYEGIDR